MLKEFFDLINRLFICRHEWQKRRNEDGSPVIYGYVGGYKILHRCVNCRRFKWFDTGAENFPPEYVEPPQVEY